jgi:hypothetical protein
MVRLSRNAAGQAAANDKCVQETCVVKDIPRPNEKLGHPLRARTGQRGKGEFCSAAAIGGITAFVISFMIAAALGVGSPRQSLLL